MDQETKIHRAKLKPRASGQEIEICKIIQSTIRQLRQDREYLKTRSESNSKSSHSNRNKS